MIETARAEEPNREWILSGIEDWTPASTFDVVFSNAALQWLPDHCPLVQRLLRTVAVGGALAFQIPSADFAIVRDLIHDTALDGEWASRMSGPLAALTMESPALYYDCLSPHSRSIDIWQTEYIHVMDSATAIVDWISSTGLRPFLNVLKSEEETQLFLARLNERVHDSYWPQADGRVLFPFKRTFVVAYR
jgi:trans-aconitate 2-methyltransferase